jgi:hypothetical protein
MLTIKNKKSAITQELFLSSETSAKRLSNPINLLQFIEAASFVCQYNRELSILL